MYIVLNYKLDFKKDINEENYYEISVNSDKKITLDSYDIVKLNNMVKENYSLGDDIHVYCINENSIQKRINEIQNKIIYKFQIKSEVEFKVLKESSKHKNLNNFMIYKFCSTIETLIVQNKWEQCVNGLIETLDFKTLLDISNYLRDLPKNSQNMSILNETSEKIEEKALIKSFDKNSIKMSDIIKLLDNNKNNESLIISRLKIHIYSSYLNLNSLEDEIKLLSNLKNKNLLNVLCEDYANKLIISQSSSEIERKEIFKKSEYIFGLLINFLEENSFDSFNIKEKYNFLVKQNKRLIF